MKIINSIINEKIIWIGVPIVYLFIFWIQGGIITFKHPISIIFIAILFISLVANSLYKIKEKH